MTEYIVTAGKLNFRETPSPSANVLAVLPRGQILDGAPEPAATEWLHVKTSLPSANAADGYVFAAYAAPSDGKIAASAIGPVAGGTGLSVNQLWQLAPQKITRRLADKNAILAAVAAEMASTGVRFGINQSPLVMAHFLAQAAKESDGFHTTREYASGAEYQGRVDLKNTQPGDGVRYKGRGIFQLTGRGHYEDYGKQLGLNLIDNPELAADPKTSFLIACQYWKNKGLERLALADDIRGITLRVNGGYNGYAERLAYYQRARRIFA